MGVTVGGVSLDTLVWNVTSRTPRMGTAARVGANLPRAGLDGAAWQAGKPLSELAVELSLWIVGSDPYGDLPDEPHMRRRVAARYERLQRIVARQDGLVEVVDTESQRRCFAEVGAELSPAVMAGGSRAVLTLPLVVPAGCWEDVGGFDTGTVPLPSSGPITVTGGGGGTLPLLGLSIRLTPPARNLRLETTDGHWVTFGGDLPAGADTVLDLDPAGPTVAQDGGAVSLLAAVNWDSTAALPIPGSDTDPVLTVSAEATTAASAIRISGRRRWLSA